LGNGFADTVRCGAPGARAIPLSVKKTTKVRTLRGRLNLSSASRAPSDPSYKTIFMSNVELCALSRERVRCTWRKTGNLEGFPRRMWRCQSLADSQSSTIPWRNRILKRDNRPCLVSSLDVCTRWKSGRSAIQGRFSTSLSDRLQSCSNNRRNPPNRAHFPDWRRELHGGRCHVQQLGKRNFGTTQSTL
jgi:hypothetical protein